MSKLLMVGVMLANESHSGIGHMACTLGGVNYESRGHAGCLKGSAARGAANPLFNHRFHRLLDDQQAARAKAYADRCVGQPYVWASVPTATHGGDCSGYVSGIVASATGKPLGRLFGTSTWSSFAAHFGFHVGLSGAGAVTGTSAKGATGIGVLDRPFPGLNIERNSPKRDHVKWVQARLNFAAHHHHPVLAGRALDVDGDFGDDTFKVVVAFQKRHGLLGLGTVGGKTWKLLNEVR